VVHGGISIAIEKLPVKIYKRMAGLVGGWEVWEMRWEKRR